jgi:hypothetical protein
MSLDPISDAEHPDVDDETLSEVVRRPTRTAGDLSEAADASPGITTEDLARDLEAIASKRGVSTESELLTELLRRVERIEEHLGMDAYQRSRATNETAGAAKPGRSGPSGVLIMVAASPVWLGPIPLPNKAGSGAFAFPTRNSCRAAFNIASSSCCRWAR